MIEPLRALLSSALETTDTGGVCVVRFGDADEARSLWQIFDKSKGRAFSWTTVIILFDGQADSAPASSRTFRPDLWLSPWDWAIAASLKSDQVPKGVASKSFRCLIIDLLPEDAGRYGRIRFKSAGAFAPWIRWYRPNGLAEADAQPLTHSFDDLYRDLKQLDGLPALRSGQTPSHNLRSAWLAQLGSVYNRHSIGNLIGPLLLQRALKRTQGIDVDLGDNESLANFHNVMGSLLGLGNIATNKPKEEILQRGDLQKRYASDPLNRYNTIRFVLVDDQVELGYHALLARTLFGKNCIDQSPRQPGEYSSAWAKSACDVSLRSLCSADQILDWIEQALRKAPQGLRVIAPDELDVLFLDLRLFSTADAGEAERVSAEPLESRMKHWDRLLSIANTMGICDSDTALSRVLRAVKIRKSRPESDENLETLALLPLILAEVDPSLPIVLFSSTHQSSLMGLFDGYPNVITTFRKPIITGYDGGEEERGVLGRLELSIRRALDFHEARGVWIRICKLDSTFRKKPSGVSPIRLKTLRCSTNRKATFEIRHDVSARLGIEYKTLIGNGQYANALLIPHNILEYEGGSVSSPVEQASVLWLRDLVSVCAKNPGRELTQLENELVDDSTLRRQTQALVENAVAFSAHRSAVPQQDLTWLADQVRYEDVRGVWKFKFKRSRQQTLAAYKRLGSVIGHSDFDQRVWMEEAVRDFTSKLIQDSLDALKATSSIGALAEYQGFAIFAALRNARAHFRVRPGEHDQEVRSAALWSWALFLDVLELLLTPGGDTLLPAKPEDQNLRFVVEEGCLPTGTIPTGKEGGVLIDTIIARLGCLVSRNIFSANPVLNPLVKYAVKLAKTAELV